MNLLSSLFSPFEEIPAPVINNPIKIPPRKQMIDAAYLFAEAGVTDPYLVNGDLEAFSAGYFLGIEKVLSSYLLIQQELSAVGIFEGDLERFKLAASHKVADEEIRDLFDTIAYDLKPTSEYSFIKGYRLAEERSAFINSKIFSRQKEFLLSDQEVYPYFWELTATELIDLPCGIVKSCIW